MNRWCEGGSRSGKSTWLLEEWQRWAAQQEGSPQAPQGLILVSNGQRKRALLDRCLQGTDSAPALAMHTPLGFIQNQVQRFYPLILERRSLSSPLPVRLQTEMEQALASRLWWPVLEKLDLSMVRTPLPRLIRQALDLWALAAAAAMPFERFLAQLDQDPTALGFGFTRTSDLGQLWHCLAELVLSWRDWCLERGLLTYSLMCELFWRDLLPHGTYQDHLARQYGAVFADDVDDFPAIALDLCTKLLDLGKPGAFTHNPMGQTRLGLNADPQAWQTLRDRCEPITLEHRAGLYGVFGREMVTLLEDGIFPQETWPHIDTISTATRPALLRRLTDTLIAAIHTGQIQPREVAIIAPGLDEIARYGLLEIFRHQNIAIEPLNEQRPLISSPVVRSLLTLVCFVYPQLGRLIQREDVAEMLVILSGQPHPITGQLGQPLIDPVRAGFLVDHCYQPDPRGPQLLSVQEFPRWDRLGAIASQTYEALRQWIQTQRADPPEFLAFLHTTVKKFHWPQVQQRPSDRAILEEFLETIAHIWGVEQRLSPHLDSDPTPAIANVVKLLHQGTATGNPNPRSVLQNPDPNAIILATVFQYRSWGHHHPWQFWLDVGSPLWLQAGAGSLFGAELFLRDQGRLPNAQEKIQGDRQRLTRIIQDLLSRCDQKLVLCHSELAVTGQEQTGPLALAMALAPPEETPGS